LSWNRIFKIIPNLGKVSSREIFKLILKFKAPIKELNNYDLINFDFNKIRISKRGFANLISYLKSFESFNSESKPSFVIQKIRSSIKPYIQKNFENFKERLADIDAVFELSQEYKSITHFIDHLNLNISEISSSVKQTTHKEDDNHRIILSTIHKAKGLEWDIVFIISLSEKLFPTTHITKKEQDIEEERRIFYVAVTRARDELFLISPKSTQSYKRMTLLNPSRFVSELDCSLYELIDFSNNSINYHPTILNQNDINKNISKPRKKYNSSQFLTADELLKGKN
jgi:DNA helicase-2/ATP-dependent DNA helicase PcrA